MDQVFAPWRIEWVERSESVSERSDDANDADDGDETANADETKGERDGDDCVFCRFAVSDADREHRVVARSERGFVLLNNYPYSPGHAMVIPRQHASEYTALDGTELVDHARLLQRTLRAVEAAFDPDGTNIGYNLGEGAGGSIPHLHAHVVPRWEGDTNFMATVADTQVIVEALSDSYDELHEAFAAQPDATVPDADRAVSFE